MRVLCPLERPSTQTIVTQIVQVVKTYEVLIIQYTSMNNVSEYIKYSHCEITRYAHISRLIRCFVGDDDAARSGAKRSGMLREHLNNIIELFKPSVDLSEFNDCCNLGQTYMFLQVQTRLVLNINFFDILRRIFLSFV